MTVIPTYGPEDGLEPGEVGFRTPGGTIVVFPDVESEPGGVSYVRFLSGNLRTGNFEEVAYWDVAEWSESPEQGREVMGAILGLAFRGLKE